MRRLKGYGLGRLSSVDSLPIDEYEYGEGCLVYECPLSRCFGLGHLTFMWA
jgi:hypothetical protein